MADYSSLKVPELKKLLGERGLTQTGNKADLIARLQEHDEASKATAAKATTEDEIDWDDEQPAAEVTKKPLPAPEPAATTASEPAEEPAPNGDKSEPSVPAAVVDDDSKTASVGDGTTGEQEDELIATKDKAINGDKDVVEAAAVSGLSQHLDATDADEEAKKRAARAKRFGIVEDEQAKKKAERAERFGLEQSTIVKGLDAALPDRPRKRGRGNNNGDDGNDDNGGGNKRATPDRRNGDSGHGRGRFRRRNGGGRGRRDSGDRNNNSGNNSAQKRPSVLYDAEERRKAEARAKRFAN